MIKSLLIITLMQVFSLIAFAEIAPNNCTTSQCHTNMGNGRWAHGPFAVGQCLQCHEQVGNHKFKPIGASTDALCYSCHTPQNTMKGVHKPVRDGYCTKCHSPHESPYRYFLKKEGKDLCLSCHDKALTGGKYVHGPVAAGDCNTCHSSHQTDFPKLLSDTSNNVCFSCHSDKGEGMASSKFVHKPAQKCVSCHSPHSSNFPYNLSADGQNLCFKCHTDKRDSIPKNKVQHGGLQTEKQCQACHNPHFSNVSKLLNMKPMDLCLSCHDKPYQGANGKLIDMKQYLANNKDTHGPVREGDCSACHNTHGSDNFRILRKYFPPVFYAPFDPKNYDLCFSCHEKTIVLNPKTKTETNFRNGDRNLHYLHVNKSVKGRTCRACHEAHATNNPRHIRDEVPFSSTWNLPIGFKIAPNGGSCLPGCHQKVTYDRLAPAKNPPQFLQETLWMDFIK